MSVHTHPAFTDFRWDRAEASTSPRAAGVQVIADETLERWQVLTEIHLAFPGLRVSPLDVLEANDGTWTFPIPRKVYDIIHYDDIDFDFTDTDPASGETIASFVITGSNINRQGA